MKKPRRAHFELHELTVMQRLLQQFLVLFFCVTALNAQAPVSVTRPFAAIDANRRYPKMTTAPDGRIVMTYAQEQGSRGLIYVSLSSDAGQTWTEPLFVTDVLFGTIGLQRQPYAMMDEAGVLHLVLEDQRVKGQVDVFYTRSSDNGRTWTSPASVVDDPDGRSLQDFSSLAIIPGGTILITFLDKRSVSDPYRHIYVVRSTDRGITWSLPSQVDRFETAASGGACECCIQNIAAAADGRVAVAFRSNLGNQRDVYIAPSNDGGSSFMTPLRIASGTWTIDACPATGPTITFDSANAVHLAWMDERDAIGVSTIWYGRWTWMSRMLPSNTLIMSSETSMPNWPDVAVTPDGRHVGVAWQTSNGVLVARSTDGGSAFDTAPVDTRPGDQDFAHIVSAGSGRFLVSWQGIRDEFYDVFITTDVPTSVADTSAPESALSAIYVDLLGRMVTRPTTGMYLEVRGTAVRPIIRW